MVTGFVSGPPAERLVSGPPPDQHLRRRRRRRTERSEERPTTIAGVRIRDWTTSRPAPAGVRIRDWTTRLLGERGVASESRDDFRRERRGARNESSREDS